MPDKVLGGRYIIQDKIGTGGMAIVYRGIDNRLGRPVAIKTMLPQYAADPSFAARFKQEAQAAAALQSPFIVSVYDWGKDNDTYFIAMEYLRGTDLKSGVRKHGALDCKKVAQIGSQIAQALSVAHRHDIIHRDIKPQNIMVQPDGNIKVMDFGIARAKNSHLTTDNSVLGTAHYVSPEQTQGKPLGPTTDIYSLGIVMYEAATGVVPFDGDDAISVALKQVNEQPVPPSARNPRVDQALERIILKCMQKDPKNRFQTAEEVFKVLRDYLAGKMTEVNNATTQMPVMATNAVSPLNSTTALPHIANSATQNRKSATHRAQLRAQEDERRHKNKVIAGVLGAALVLIAIIVALVSYFMGQGATQEVPNLLNLTQQEALMKIDNSNFFQRGTVKEEFSSTVEKGKVIDQDPDAGHKVAKGTQINIVVSKGTEPAADVTVPDLKGKSPSEAEAILSKLGLKSQAGDSVNSDDVEVGKIAAQTPAAGTTAKAGDTITYQLSKGPDEADVPNVVGKTEDEAQSALQAAGFNVSVQREESNKPEGTVTKQSATGKLTRKSTVTITVAKAPSQVSLSTLISKGMDATEASQKLSDAGFNVRVKRQPDALVKKDTVISFPDKAKKGQTVTLVVSDGLPLINDSH
ncbi:Stk1 family PASTA domain-containing Ser/Thr kinase [Fannyhessea vaginae]|uniref:Stk1 family PASTA domain-containing Ser/Thr kinase n=1 Tax=Fannyhessea vaginae TaxID=82135 RepID=UPI002889633E|nr:Stk1 family PASTA domain-containing Ser/Thr kinase [Fannyhessea vaginae]